MAQKTHISLVDDLDGGEAHQTVEFGLDGVEYEIDLSDDNAERFRATLGEFLEAARRTGGRRKPALNSVNGHRKSATDPQASLIRDWARKNGHPDLGDRGRIPQLIVAAYHEAHAPEPEPEPAKPATRRRRKPAVKAVA